MKKLILINFLIILFLIQFIKAQNYYHWFPVHTETTQNLNSIMPNAAVGNNGTILFSTGGGYNWILVPGGTTSDLKGISANYSVIICAVGANGTILRSTNNGLSWSPSSSGTNVTLYSCTRTIYQDFLAVGASGKILFSSDGGVTWNLKTSGTNNDLYSLGGSGFNYWAAGANGSIVYTTDNGNTWSPQSSGLTVNINSIKSANLTQGCAVGNNGKVIVTTNGGINWILKNSGTTNNLKSVAMSFITDIYVCGDAGLVMYSTDTCNSWIPVQLYTNANLNSIYSNIAGDSGKIFIYAYDSALVRTYFSGNRISTWLLSSGIFNQDTRVYNTPGFEWPKGSGSFAIFTSGLSIAANYNGQLREAMGSYTGEYYPGYIADSLGVPTTRTDLRFRFYKVNHGDNMNNNPDWLNWGLMVPFGAPYTDVNHNGIYEPNLDTPGVHGATQTIFICITDGFTWSHTLAEGFGGGTLPLFAEVHMTAWSYDNPVIQDVQFIKWDIINKSHTSWTSTYVSIVNDPDLGCANDDFIGCDTVRYLGYTYNGGEIDCNGVYRYPGVPPAVGFQWLNCNGVSNIGFTSFDYFICVSCPSPSCENDPNGETVGAYNFMRGLKKDETPWVVPPGGSASLATKFIYSGDPETGQGWTEGLPGSPTGCVWNCGGPGHYSGDVHSPNIMGDRRMVLSSGSDNLTLNPGDTVKIMIAQLIAQGTNNLNSVTQLKILADTVKAFCNRGFVIGTERISSAVPERFMLFQNYPNPFNPVTKIKFTLPLTKGAGGMNTELIIYDVLGREVATLVNEKLKSGTYSTDWDATNYPSGVYFYKLSYGNFNQTKKMVLLK